MGNMYNYTKYTKCNNPFKLKNMLIKTMFAWLLFAGVVAPMEEQNDERDMYCLYVTNEQGEILCFEHAYKEEIYNYIETGEFEYNDFLYEPAVVQQKLTKNK